MRYRPWIPLLGAGLGLFCASGVAANPQAEIGIEWLGDTEPSEAESSGRSSATAAAARAAFTMKPSVQAAPRCKPSTDLQTTQLNFFCFRQDTGQLIPNCDFQVAWRARFGSGGHEHHTQRPPGEFAAGPGNKGGSVGPGPEGFIAFNTGASGVSSLIYTAPEAASDIEVQALGTGIVDGRQFFLSIGFEIAVTEANLVRASGAGLLVATVSDMHGQNNGYATGATTDRLRTMAAEFARRLVQEHGVAPAQVPVLRATAISLPRGGLFDFRTEWAPPHCGHRRGDQVDLGRADLLLGARRHGPVAPAGAQFVIRNPNASTTCGCGNSFSV